MAVRHPYEKRQWEMYVHILERDFLPGMFGGGGGDHGPGIRGVLPGSDAIFFRSMVTGPGFLKILNGSITLLKKSLAAQSRIFENPQRLDYAF
ncbi:MAG: hypothetical protein ABFC78_02250 [Methanoregula sp.]